MNYLTSAAISEIQKICPGGVACDVSLASISQWRVGGYADLVVRPSTVLELSNLRRWFHLNRFEHVVVGATTNLLFSDDGLKVPCIQIGSRLSGMTIYDDTIHVLAGTWVPHLARSLMRHGLAGGVHFCGIPGSLGGLVCMNGGSQRKSVGDSVVCVESVTDSGIIISRLANECDFSYRGSIYQSNNEIISSAIMRFDFSDKKIIRRDMLAVLAGRRRKFPRKLPNCGSVFKSNPAMYESVGTPGSVIEEAGLKGYRIGGAQISMHHANFIVNVGAATAEDIMRLIRVVKDAVYDRTGYALVPEVCYIGEYGDIASENGLDKVSK